MLVPEQRQAADEALQALADGELTGYQAVRSFRAPDGPTHELALWVCAVDVEGGRLGLISAVPLDGRGAQIDPVTAVLSAPTPGHVALGTLDLQWRVDRISHDVVEILGYQLEEMVGLPVLGGLHPGDLPVFLAAVERARAGQRAVVVSVRLRARSGHWAPVRAVLATLSEDYPPALAFALTTGGNKALKAVGGGDDRSRLDAEIQRVTRDLRVAGIVPRLDRLPDVARFPELSRLTAREWQILVLLLEGERVASIAGELYVSQSTVRNHLSSIFSKLGVHSQAELIHRLHLD
jgi:PAS domain S-box-containing protein